MADSPEKRIDIIYNNLKNDITPRDVMLRIGRAQAARAVDLCRERTDRGLDVSGNPFDSYSPRYSRKKQRIISGRGKLFSGRRTTFAAKRMPSFMRLSGAMFANLTFMALRVTRSGGEARVTFRIGFSSEAMRKRAQYNEEKGRKWVGLAKPGTSVGQRERKELIAIGREGLKMNARARGIVLQEDT